MKLYLYPKCSTCKKAVHFLEKHGISFVAKDVTRATPTTIELHAMLALQGGQLRKLFNTSGELYRSMGLSEKLDSYSTSDAFKLLQQHGMLIKRPFLIGDKIGLTGFNESTWSASLL